MSTFTRRKFLKRSAQLTAALSMNGAASFGAGSKVGEAFVSERRSITDAVTGRRLIQLTAGDCFDMPMYYFIPTFAGDGKTIVFQRYDHHTGEVQLYKIHAETGVTARLTD